ncbi:MAG TPA: glycosyltransferase [Kineosporiaceae bacterium]
MDELNSAPRSAPAPGPVRPPRRLTIGMATYDDYDGVYFTASSLRMYHREVADQFDILVVDNHPQGAGAHALKQLEAEVPGLRYFPVDDIQSPAVKDRVFREATSDWVLCLDSHVLLAPGAIARLLQFIEDHPQCPDLLQGPLLTPHGYLPQQEPEWCREAFGRWSFEDAVPGLPDPDSEPFEIEMQGMGLFACRRDAWPGFNPLFRGHGGEEGYIHAKFKALGRRTICLPFLAWQHRFTRPGGPPYRLTRGDRIRNFLIGWEELGRPVDEVLEYFRNVYGPVATNAVERIWTWEKESPLSFFTVIAGLNPGRDDRSWSRLHEQVSPFNVEQRLRRIRPTAGSADAQPPSADGPSAEHLNEVASAVSHREIVVRAVKENWSSVLVLHDDATFLPGALETLQGLVQDLQVTPWLAVDLSADLAAGADPHRHPSLLAVAYHQRSYRAILQALSADEAGIARVVAGAGGLAGLLRRTLGDGYQRVEIVAQHPRPLAA